MKLLPEFLITKEYWIKYLLNKINEQNEFNIDVFFF